MQRPSPYQNLLRIPVSSYICLIYSGADIYAEDQSLWTPVLTAAAHGRIKSFHCLMELMDLENELKNPIFQVLHVKKHRAETLKVNLHSFKVNMIGH